MANEKRLIDANQLITRLEKMKHNTDAITIDGIIRALKEPPTVDAVEVPDKQLLRAVKLLLKQYEHSKQSDYVHNPVAHAFFHTWKAVDKSGCGKRRDGE